MLPAHIFPTRSPVEDIGLIRVFHPGYDDDCSLIEFDGYDDENGGIWREVVVTACAIISNNRFNGQLRDRAGNTQNMDILPAGDYTWHVPGDDVYAIIPSFQDWRMPFVVPSVWRTTSTCFTAIVCSVLLQNPAVDRAHIVPESEAEWFQRNVMGSRVRAFSDNRGNSINHHSNLIALSASLHRSFDAKEWAFFPKDGEIVVQPMERRAAVWSNQTLKCNVLKEHLLARFAWTLFPRYVEAWLRSGRSRQLLINGERKEVSDVDCMNLSHAPYPKITSPKRKRSESPQNDAGANIPVRGGTLVKEERGTS